MQIGEEEASMCGSENEKERGVGEKGLLVKGNILDELVYLFNSQVMLHMTSGSRELLDCVSCGYEQCPVNFRKAYSVIKKHFRYNL